METNFLRKCCKFTLKFILFISLVISCYFFFMIEAIEKFNRGATTVTKRSIDLPYEYPTLIICPNPSFKPSVSKKHDLEIPIRDIFNQKTKITKRIYQNIFPNQTVPDLYKEFSYHSDITFVFEDPYNPNAFIDLKSGKNKFGSLEIEWKKIEVSSLGTCHLLHTRQRIKNSHIDSRIGPYIYIAYKKGLKKQDVPKSFRIYFTTKNDWHNIVLRTWTGFQYPFQIDTSLYNLPLEIGVTPLSRLHYYSVQQNIRKEKMECFNTTRIREELSAGNCKDSCIPINFRSLFSSSEIKTCVTYNDHFCALYSTFPYIERHQENCTKTKIEKYFNGFVSYKEGMTHNLPKIIGKQRRDRTLVLLYWRYGSKKVIISEEQLIYNSKDLVAWIGGALGIFVGYSFFNLSQHIIDIVFYLFPTIHCSKASKESGHSPEVSNGDKYLKSIRTLRPKTSLF